MFPKERGTIFDFLINILVYHIVNDTIRVLILNVICFNIYKVKNIFDATFKIQKNWCGHNTIDFICVSYNTTLLNVTI